MILKCSNCGFILGTKPGLKNSNGECQACINSKQKDKIDFEERKSWLTDFILENKTNAKYDCIIAVSGGKDSTTIVRRLFESHGVKKALLISVLDPFTQTETSKRNMDNILQRYNCDLISFRTSLNEQINLMLNDFENELNPVKSVEQKIKTIPVQLAEEFGIKLVFYGEDTDFEFGISSEMKIFSDQSNEKVKVIYLGSIWRYSTIGWFEDAVEVGFKDLNYLNEWQRYGSIENNSQINSIGYHMGQWLKFPKFGYQRVSEIACRYVREGYISRLQAENLIKDQDFLCDSESKIDFCRVLGISLEYFDETVDKFANRNILTKDLNGNWKRKDLVNY